MDLPKDTDTTLDPETGGSNARESCFGMEDRNSEPLLDQRLSTGAIAPKIYVQLNVLDGGEEGRFWKRSARWIKYEEVEEVAGRLGRPRIPTLSFHSLTSLRQLLEAGVTLLDLEETDLPGIAFRVAEQIGLKPDSGPNDLSSTLRLFLLQHRQGQGSARTRRVSWIPGLGPAGSRRGSWLPGAEPAGGSTGNLHNNAFLDEKRRRSVVTTTKPELLDTSTFLAGIPVLPEENEESGWLLGRQLKEAAALRRILSGTTEATLVLVGKEESLPEPILAFVRLAKATFLPHVTEVPVPVRFVVILLGPSSVMSELEYKEIGRSVSTLMSNSVFHSIARTAAHPSRILQGITEFVQDSIVLPPGDWDPDLFPYEELKQAKKVIRQQRKSIVSIIAPNAFAIQEVGNGLRPLPTEDLLKRRGKLFGGLIADARRRCPRYWSDIRDGFSLQCLATIIFVYFGCVAGNIAFGGLMGKKTDNYIGISETLVGAGVSGVTFALFSGQPLLLLGTTGPLMIFDESLFKFCSSYDMTGTEFLGIRTWIGLWLSMIALTVAAFEGTVVIRLFTRFTQEIFSTLISVVFIVESLKNLGQVYVEHPLTGTYGTCDLNGAVVPDESKPNVALLSTILMLGTYLIANNLKAFRNSKYFNATTRDTVGNFAVLLAIILMGGLDYAFKDTETQKLSLPDVSQGLQTSLPNRTWIISAEDGGQTPLGPWIMILAVFPAFLLYILVFMESSISELLVSKDEMRLRKGGGFHLDILLICLINTGLGFIGTGWVAAPTIRSLTHAISLTVLSTNNPPGEKPKILWVKEQRVTSLAVSLLVGLSVFMADILRFVPMAVLFGVFLYMGLSSLDGVQLVERVGLLFKEADGYPQVPYVSRVRRWKMHLYTLVQLVCLGVLWAVKESPAGLVLALLILLLVPFRFWVLKFCFNPTEMKALDGAQGQEPEEDESELEMESGDKG